ncbi:MAG: rhomboid family intramembrane serine protease, partial [Treponema sp.]|nr:rhomboid family intramembrane serine protease [Treponema sp.]
MNIFRRQFRYRFDSLVFYLIGINVLVFLAQGLLNLTPFLAMTPWVVLRGWVWQFVTYMFAHGNWQHILFNMLGLFIFGIQVERRMGSAEFLLYYLTTGILAGIASFAVYLFTGDINAHLLGASGAIFAVELAFAAYYPDALIYIWGILPLRAPVMVLGYTALEVVFSITGSQRGVAHLTHLFGFAAGWMYFL